MKIVKSVPESFYHRIPFEETEIVREVIDDVRRDGDKAVIRYTEKFDQYTPSSLEVGKDDIERAYENVDENVTEAIMKAHEHIKEFAEIQIASLKDFELKTKWSVLGQKIIPIDKVGCYVPGGRYPLPSSALMSITPARVAGVEKIVVCSPKIRDETIIAADVAGADRIFSVGGIQAIAAMAYGTETIPHVHMIVGPGNKYVTEAKRMVYGDVGIDFLAGPSEVVIVADDSGDASLIATDMMSQAEHDPLAQAHLVTTSEKLALDVDREIREQLKDSPTRDVASQSLENSYVIIVDSMEKAYNITNKRAPEHVELQVKDEETAKAALKHYGSLFIGKDSAESFGDYASGTNHILPTGGGARFTGGLSVFSFLKIQTYQKITSPDLIADIVAELAKAEGLDSHMRSALKRKN
ncbi:MAG TPA: histidinol dehydrogenase [Candidatus Methanofastidiosa archaeon]|nr:histidinol dehydrogenase [Candidatus Methanofastidiosa archaeon]